LGRVYSGLIKKYGGRAFDIGTVFDFWSNNNFHSPRLSAFLKRNPTNFLEMILTDKGKVFEDYI